MTQWKNYHLLTEPLHWESGQFLQVNDIRNHRKDCVLWACVLVGAGRRCTGRADGGCGRPLAKRRALGCPVGARDGSWNCAAPDGPLRKDRTGPCTYGQANRLRAKPAPRQEEEGKRKRNTRYNSAEIVVSSAVRWRHASLLPAHCPNQQQSFPDQFLIISSNC